MRLIQRLSYLGKNGYNGYTAFSSVNHASLHVTTERLRGGYVVVTGGRPRARAKEAEGAQKFREVCRDKEDSGLIVPIDISCHIILLFCTTKANRSQTGNNKSCFEAERKGRKGNKRQPGRRSYPSGDHHGRQEDRRRKVREMRAKLTTGLETAQEWTKGLPQDGSFCQKVRVRDEQFYLDVVLFTEKSKHRIRGYSFSFLCCGKN